MIDKLIEEGKALEDIAQDGMGIKFFNSIEFEKWVSKCILYLENYHTESSLTEKAKEKNKNLNTNNNYDFYTFLLGTLKATKEFEDDQSEDVVQF